MNATLLTAALLSSLCLCTVARADLVRGGPSTVMSQTMSTYTYESSGDVVFELSGNPATGCDGFWLRASDPGFKNDFAILLTMAQTQGTFSVWADNSPLWPGSSSGRFCLVYSLVL